jgi:hypothetical protein
MGPSHSGMASSTRIRSSAECIARGVKA